MTVTPVADPCVGNLATPVNSSYFSRAFLNALPAYRPSLSPNRRGLEVGMAHGFFLYGPFAITGPLRNTEFAIATCKNNPQWRLSIQTHKLLQIP